MITLSNTPSANALSKAAKPFVKRPNVVQINTCFAFMDFNCLAVSSILSPEEIISSMIIISLPSISLPRNSWATIGFLPFTMVE